MKRLILMRGLPGSGKTTLAKTFGGEIFATDDYFQNNGDYRFDPTKIAEAHEWNQQRVSRAMAKSVETIVVDNTNILRIHMIPYVRLARKYGYEVRHAIPDTPWAFDPEGCFEHCVHRVPLNVIDRMLNDWEEIPANP